MYGEPYGVGSPPVSCSGREATAHPPPDVPDVLRYAAGSARAGMVLGDHQRPDLLDAITAREDEQVVARQDLGVP